MSIPLVSIIIPTYNRVKIIGDTLVSIVNQTYLNWECIIVDDGSTDTTVDYINDYSKSDKRFNVYVRPKERRKGPSSCRNFGLEKAKGEFIIFLDSDDLLAIYCLEERIIAFKNYKECDFLVFQMERFVNSPQIQIKIPLEEVNIKHSMPSFLSLNSIWQITSPIYKKKILEKVKGFNESLLNFEDLELAIKSIIAANNYKRFNNIDSFYRNDSNYKLKYKKIETKKRSVKAFIIFLSSINNYINSLSDASEIDFCKKQVVTGYQKLFLLNIKDHIEDFRLFNNRILFFLNANNYLSKKQKAKFYFVKNIVAKFYKFKNVGVYRLIKLIYKIE